MKKTGTREISDASASSFLGCKNGCSYCWAYGLAVRRGRVKPGEWEDEKFDETAFNKHTKGRKKKRVLYGATHDLRMEHIDVHVQKIRQILNDGNDLVITSKAFPEVMKRIVKDFSDEMGRFVFLMDIGSTDTRVIRWWEKNTSSYEERAEAMKFLSEEAVPLGAKLGIIAEPLLDNHPERIIEQLGGYVSGAKIYLGTMNQGANILSITKGWTPEIKKAYDQLVQWQARQNLRELYLKYRNDPRIAFKNPIPQRIGILDGRWDPDAL